MMSNLPALDSAGLLHRMHGLHELMRDGLRERMLQDSLESLSRPIRYEGGDTIFSLDTRGEEILLPYCKEWARETPFLLICEGLEGGRLLLGTTDEALAQFILICDPVDGTRPLMYDKRSAWLLLGVAPNLGPTTNLSHIEVALQGELPHSRAGWADVLWASRGRGAGGESINLYTGQKRPVRLQPSGASSIAGGYAMLSKFFPGSKGWLAQLEEKLVAQVLGEPQGDQPLTFDDQYISTGGQLHELITGRDRFNGDLRPLAHARLHGGAGTRLCTHPYDIATELIAREAGVIITDEHGNRLSCPLDVTTPVSWLAYANESIRTQIEGPLLSLLHES
jgi:hypothetical protein